jgi:hypothetical protein
VERKIKSPPRRVALYRCMCKALCNFHPVFTCMERMYKAKKNQSQGNLTRVDPRITLGNGMCETVIKYTPFPAWVYLPAYGLQVNPRRETPRKQEAIEMTLLGEYSPEVNSTKFYPALIPLIKCSFYYCLFYVVHFFLAEIMAYFSINIYKIRCSFTSYCCAVFNR